MYVYGFTEGQLQWWSSSVHAVPVATARSCSNYTIYSTCSGINGIQRALAILTETNVRHWNIAADYDYSVVFNGFPWCCVLSSVSGAWRRKNISNDWRTLLGLLLTETLTAQFLLLLVGTHSRVMYIKYCCVHNSMYLIYLTVLYNRDLYSQVRSSENLLDYSLNPFVLRSCLIFVIYSHLKISITISHHYKLRVWL